MPLCNLQSTELECWRFIPIVKDPHANTKYSCFRANSQARCYSRLFFLFRLSWRISRKVDLIWEKVNLIWENWVNLIWAWKVGKITRLRLYKRCKMLRNVKRQDWYSAQITYGKNVYKRRLVNYEHIWVRRNVEHIKLISFELTKVGMRRHWG